MINYHITPRAPLIFRDGKPFGTEDNIADTLLFPLPSTLAGALRTAWADSEKLDYNNDDDIAKIKKKAVCGPILTCTQNNITELMFPAPADSVCLNDGYAASTIYRLKPADIASNEIEGTDLPGGLLPVFLENNIKGKPAKDTPKFWKFNKMRDWLLNDDIVALDADEQGIQNLPIEVRTHVSIDPQSHTAKAGYLFQTAGLDFSCQRKTSLSNSNCKSWGWKDAEYGIACSFQENIPDTFRTIGGESRLGYIRKEETLIPECPIELTKALANARYFRLILITPAIFKKGYIPGWLDESFQGTFRNMKLTLKAVSISRWQAGTSWDMASVGSKDGKGMRGLKRLAPAGTVYWFEKEPGSFNAEGFWLTSISDDHVHDQDGYGLTLPAVWTPSNPFLMKEK
ncbi:MAG: type III-B CRISPR module-associated Cmr3 family protein [Methylococcaceae bacterium]